MKDSPRVSSSSDRCCMADYRCTPSPFDSSPPASMLADVIFEVFPEIFERALERFCGTRGQRAKRMAGTEKLGLGGQFIDIAVLSTAFFDGAEGALTPSQSCPAWSTPAAGFLREKALQIPYHSDGARLIVEHNHGSCAHAAAGFLDFGKIHFHVEVLFSEKVRRCATRQQPAKPQTFAHSAGVFLQNFANRGSHRKLPQSRPLHFSTD